MTKESKAALRQIALAVVPPILVLLLTAAIRGEELAGLSKAAAFLRLFRIGIPLWLFLIVLIVAVLTSAHWIQTVVLRKETLRIAWQPERCLWGTGASGNKPMMQIIASGYLTNTSENHRMIITSIYLKGTKPVVGMFEPMEIEAATCSNQHFNAYVEPIVGKLGETYEGKLILVDQFGIKHKAPIDLKSTATKSVDSSQAKAGKQ